MTLYFITGNDDKYAEVKALLPEVERLDLDLPEVQSLDPRAVIRAKLFAAHEQHEGSFIVEDTSLSVAGLGGLPGPFIKWFLEAMSLERFAEIAVASQDPSAEAMVCIGYLAEGDEPVFFEGVLKGEVVFPRGERGFGWDKVFVPEGFDETFGEMAPEVKNSFSMRQQAVAELKEYLRLQEVPD
ncbi:non-canonical purine NTP pyrophosphatase [Candidatus Woesearchaeota archaeon]|nr:non-canonical purine NTP pyrophosphatase [Candidatus Woesearchaeota archaeon]